MYAYASSRQDLIQLGILEDLVQDSESNTVACHVPVEHAVPMFTFRQGKPRRTRRRSEWYSVPLHLSLSTLSDDTDIARLLSPIHNTPTIQHRKNTDIPLSLPPSALASPPVFDSVFHLPQHLLDDDTTTDWTFIHSAHSTSQSPTSPSEPETWILIDDS